MVQRRDLLKTTLTLCGCAAYATLGVGGLGAEARADGPTAVTGTGYQLWFIGAQRETIMIGKLTAALDQRTLAGHAHLYGLGPLELEFHILNRIGDLPHNMEEPKKIQV